MDKLTYRNYYYQSIDNNDQLITLVSKEPPLIKNINKTMVEVTYIDESDKEQNLITHGIPHWILGMDINADIEKRKKKINKNISSKSPLLSNLVDENLKFQEETQGIEIKVPRSDTLRKSMLSDSQLNIEESVGLITDEINKQRKNDYRQLIGEGLVNYGLEDSITKMKLN